MLISVLLIVIQPEGYPTSRESQRAQRSCWKHSFICSFDTCSLGLPWAWQIQSLTRVQPRQGEGCVDQKMSRHRTRVQSLLYSSHVTIIGAPRTRTSVSSSAQWAHRFCSQCWSGTQGSKRAWRQQRRAGRLHSGCTLSVHSKGACRSHGLRKRSPGTCPQLRLL